MNALDIFERVLATVIPVFLIAGIGFAYSKRKMAQNAGTPPDMGALNTLMLDILAPLLVFTALSDRGFNLFDQRWVVVGGLIVVVGSGLVAWGIAKLRGYDVQSFVPPAMFNNCGNMGLPLAVFAFGQEGLMAAVALFTSCNLLHFTLGVKILSPQAKLAQVLKTPLTMGMVLGLLCAGFNIHLPQPLFEGLSLLGKSAVPLMLFMLGVRMAHSQLSDTGAGLVCGVLCPVAGMAFAYAAYALLPLTGAQFAYVLMFGALPPAVLNALMAVQYRANINLTTSAVVWGHVVSLASVPLALALGFSASHS